MVNQLAINDGLHKHRRIPVHYFMYHLVITSLIGKDSGCRKEWDSMPYVCNAMPHALQWYLNKPFNEKLYKHIVDQIFIHKLTYRLSKEIRNSPSPNFLQYFLKEKLAV